MLWTSNGRQNNVVSLLESLLTQEVLWTSIQRFFERYERQTNVKTTLCAYNNPGNRRHYLDVNLTFFEHYGR